LIGEPTDKLALFLALPVPWARDGEAAGVADGVTGCVCIITVSLKDTEGESDRQIRSLSSKFRSDSQTREFLPQI